MTSTASSVICRRLRLENHIARLTRVYRARKLSGRSCGHLVSRITRLTVLWAAARHEEESLPL